MIPEAGVSLQAQQTTA